MTKTVEELEIRLAYQDDLLETLNRTVIDQQRQLDAMQRSLEKLAERIATAQDGGAVDPADPAADRPPHY